MRKVVVIAATCLFAISCKDSVPSPVEPPSPRNDSIASGKCYLDPTCSENPVQSRLARDGGSNQCVNVDSDCDELWKCRTAARGEGGCGEGTVACTYSPGCGFQVQTCRSGVCVDIGQCADTIRRGYAFEPNQFQCDCAMVEPGSPAEATAREQCRG